MPHNISGIRPNAFASTRRESSATRTLGTPDIALEFKQRQACDMAAFLDLTLELSRSWRHWAAVGQ